MRSPLHARIFRWSSALLATACVACVGSAAFAGSDWVRPNGPGGRLAYKTTAAGDRIMDFSYAGYGGGGVTLPRVGDEATLSPSGADDTGAMQAAIDALASQAKLDGKSRAVKLQAGAFRLAGTLRLKTGVVLRGAGTGKTILTSVGAPHVAVKIGGQIHETSIGDPVVVTDDYVPSGATHVHVANPRGLKPGDRVRITAPVTDAWVRFMGMDRLTRGGKPEVWLSGTLNAVRTVQAVYKGGVDLTPPLSHAYDARFLGKGAVRLAKIDQQGLTREAGLEDLSLAAPAQRITLDQPSFTGLVVDGAQDFWVRNVAIADMTNDVQIGRDASRGTFEAVSIRHSVSILGAAKPFAFSISGTQILIDRSSVQGDAIWYAATNRDVQGPNVLLNCRFEGTGAVEPHQRWATGFLVDGVEAPQGGVSFQNRGEMGSGHGWAAGWSVSWNNTAAWFVIQKPPGALNWSIGDRGPQRRLPLPTFPQHPAAPDEPEGVIEQSNERAIPRSLYLAQLRDRLGPAALKAIGYEELDSR